jgi:hypothetical protein
MSSTVRDLPFNQELFEIVKKGLLHPPKGKNPTVGWDNAANALEQAQRTPDHAETKSFLGSCFSGIINIFLDQQAQLLLPEHRGCVERTFQSAIVLLANEITHGIDTHIKVLAMIFQGDINRPFFNRAYFKVGAAQSHRNTGLPESRERLLNEFSTRGGFVGLAQILEGHRTKGPAAWVVGKCSGGGQSVNSSGFSAETLKHLLSGLRDALILANRSPENSADIRLGQAAAHIVAIVTDQV